MTKMQQRRQDLTGEGRFGGAFDDSLLFERIHELGAERHGVCWMQCNIRAAELIPKRNMQYSPELKALVSEVVLRVLDYVRYVDPEFSQGAGQRAAGKAESGGAEVISRGPE